jgi:hypothetical protein
MAPIKKKLDITLTKYVELIKDQILPNANNPGGPGYEFLLDSNIMFDGGKEIRVGVHVFVDD